MSSRYVGNVGTCADSIKCISPILGAAVSNQYIFCLPVGNKITELQYGTVDTRRQVLATVQYIVLEI